MQIPWAAVAAEIDRGDQSSKEAAADSGREGQSIPDCTGRAFCFLPLPVLTGLPVHVNAFFELSSNRRDIW